MKIIINDMTEYDTSSQMRRLNCFWTKHHPLPLNVSVRIQEQPKVKDCGRDFVNSSFWQFTGHHRHSNWFKKKKKQVACKIVKRLMYIVWLLKKVISPNFSLSGVTLKPTACGAVMSSSTFRCVSYLGLHGLVGVLLLRVEQFHGELHLSSVPQKHHLRKWQRCCISENEINSVCEK